MVHRVTIASVVILLLALDSAADDRRTWSVARNIKVIVAIGDWLGAELGLPKVAELPRVEFVPKEQLINLRLGVPPDAEHDEADVSAIYSDADRTIYLPQGWTGKTAEELSILVHEFVHHVQNLSGLRYACPQAREKLAYAAQEAWLVRSGSNLTTAFGINPMTLFVRTRCFN